MTRSHLEVFNIIQDFLQFPKLTDCQILKICICHVYFRIVQGLDHQFR